MSQIPEHVRREVWERDGYRCRECGVAVAGPRGCLPQTHHIELRSAGGSDDRDNLITLCLLCHATKQSAGHEAVFVKSVPNKLPDVVKCSLWDLSLDLLAYAELLSPLRFRAWQVYEWLRSFSKAVDSVMDTVALEMKENPERAIAVHEDFESLLGPKELDAILLGVRIGWYAHAHQQYFDQKVREARTKWSQQY